MKKNFRHAFSRVEVIAAILALGVMVIVVAPRIIEIANRPSQVSQGKPGQVKFVGKDDVVWVAHVNDVISVELKPGEHARKLTSGTYWLVEITDAQIELIRTVGTAGSPGTGEVIKLNAEDLNEEESRAYISRL